MNFRLDCRWACSFWSSGWWLMCSSTLSTHSLHSSNNLYCIISFTYHILFFFFLKPLQNFTLVSTKKTVWHPTCCSSWQIHIQQHVFYTLSHVTCKSSLLCPLTPSPFIHVYSKYSQLPVLYHCSTKEQVKSYPLFSFTLGTPCPLLYTDWCASWPSLAFRSCNT